MSREPQPDPSQDHEFLCLSCMSGIFLCYCLFKSCVLRLLLLLQ